MRARDASPTRAGTKGIPDLAELCLLLSVFFVGMDVVSVKYALEGLPPLVFMPARYVLAGLLLLAFLRLLEGTPEAGSGVGTSSSWPASGLWVSPSTTSGTRSA
jgi:drug/metabolite transporter (DMT)-like permease